MVTRTATCACEQLRVTCAGELEITARDQGRFAVADGYSSYGEPVRRVRDRAGKVTEVWLAASKMLPETKIAKEMQARYGTSAAVAAARRRMRKPSRRKR